MINSSSGNTRVKKINMHYENQNQISSFFLNIKTLYKKSHKKKNSDEILTTVIYRPIGFFIAFLLYKLPVSPNFLTLCRGLTGIVSGCLFFQGIPEYTFIGAIILFSSNILDCSDGLLARMRKTVTKLGHYMDAVADLITVPIVYIGIGWQAFNKYDSGLWLILCIIAIISHMIQHSTFQYIRDDFLRDELFFHLAPDYYNNKVNSGKIKSESKTTEKSIIKKFFKLFMTIYDRFMHFYSTQLLPKILMPKKYRNFIRGYIKNENITQMAKDLFKQNYRGYNLMLLRAFGVIGFISNLTFIVIMGWLNSLDMALVIICTIFNVYFILLIIIQRLWFTFQLKLALKAESD